MRTHYEVLRVSRDASITDVRAAYRKLSRENHPDKTIHLPETERLAREKLFKEANNAYEVLSDENKKILYDAGLPKANGTSTEARTGWSPFDAPPQQPRTETRWQKGRSQEAGDASYESYQQQRAPPQGSPKSDHPGYSYTFGPRGKTNEDASQKTKTDSSKPKKPARPAKWGEVFTVEQSGWVFGLQFSNKFQFPLFYKPTVQVETNKSESKVTMKFKEDRERVGNDDPVEGGVPDCRFSFRDTHGGWAVRGIRTYIKTLAGADPFIEVMFIAKPNTQLPIPWKGSLNLQIKTWLPSSGWNTAACKFYSTEQLPPGDTPELSMSDFFWLQPMKLVDLGQDAYGVEEVGGLNMQRWTAVGYRTWGK